MPQPRKSPRGRWGWLALAAMMVGGPHAQSDEGRYLRFGTGSPGENSFTVGSAIAGSISAPPGLPPCGHGSACGVPGLIAMASATNGSVANIDGIIQGHLDAGLVQADVSAWAANGIPPFHGQSGDRMRAVANLSLEQLHLVVLRDGPIHALRDLRGKRISLGEPGSGTELHGRQLIAALGIKEGEMKIADQRAAYAADAMLAGKLDGFIVMDAAPVPAIVELAKAKAIRLIPVSGPAADNLRRADPLLVPSRIVAGLYPGVTADVPTVAVSLTLVVDASLPDDLVYGITKALWQPETQRMLSDIQRDGLPITEAGAVTNLGLPLHPGAKRFYLEQGMLK